MNADAVVEGIKQLKTISLADALRPPPASRFHRRPQVRSN